MDVHGHGRVIGNVKKLLLSAHVTLVLPPASATSTQQLPGVPLGFERDFYPAHIAAVLSSPACARSLATSVRFTHMSRWLLNLEHNRKVASVLGRVAAVESAAWWGMDTDLQAAAVGVDRALAAEVARDADRKVHGIAKKTALTAAAALRAEKKAAKRAARIAAHAAGEALAADDDMGDDNVDDADKDDNEEEEDEEVEEEDEEEAAEEEEVDDDAADQNDDAGNAQAVLMGSAPLSKTEGAASASTAAPPQQSPSESATAAEISTLTSVGAVPQEGAQLEPLGKREKRKRGRNETSEGAVAGADAGGGAASVTQAPQAAPAAPMNKQQRKQAMLRMLNSAAAADASAAAAAATAAPTPVDSIVFSRSYDPSLAESNRASVVLARVQSNAAAAIVAQTAAVAAVSAAERADGLATAADEAFAQACVSTDGAPSGREHWRTYWDDDADDDAESDSDGADDMPSAAHLAAVAAARDALCVPAPVDVGAPQSTAYGGASAWYCERHAWVSRK